MRGFILCLLLFIVFILRATGVCLLSCYLPLLAPRLFKRRHGSMKGFAHISGPPMLGGIFVFDAEAFMPPSGSLGI